MTESDTEEVKCVGPLPESESNQTEEEEQKDQSDHGSIYASSSVSGFTNSSLPRRKIIHVETGTLYQLKAEVSKTSKHVDDIKAKYGEFKAPQVSRKLLPEHLKRKRKEAKILKNKGIEERNARDAEQMAKERATADKVKRKLEAKSRVYDAVQRGEEMDDYMRENCLVDFDGKPMDKSDRGRERTSRDRSRHQSYQSESDMIEHTDALGRTSYISKKELSLVREKDREMADLTRDDYDERYSRYSDGSRSPSPENKQARFQNLDDGDIRDLGVGYYNFSADESTRQQQMSLLDTLRHSTEQNRQEQQEKTTAQAEKTRRFLEKKRKLLAKKRGLKIEDIQIPETDIVIDLPAPKPLDRTEMNIDRNIQTAKKASREWDKDKDMEEIYGEKRPVAKETNYYETQRNKREEQFAPSYSADYPKQNYQRQTQRDNTFQEYDDQSYDSYGGNQGQYNDQNSYGHGTGGHYDQGGQGYGNQQNQRHNLSNQYGNGDYGYGQQRSYGQNDSRSYGSWN